MSDYPAQLEALRRSASGTLDVRPLPQPLVYEVRDYADAGLKCEAGLTALRESLPNGQLECTVAAYNLLRQGTEDLGRWLRARGVGGTPLQPGLGVLVEKRKERRWIRNQCSRRLPASANIRTASGASRPSIRTR